MPAIRSVERHVCLPEEREVREAGEAVREGRRSV